MNFKNHFILIVVFIFSMIESTEISPAIITSHGKAEKVKLLIGYIEPDQDTLMEDIASQMRSDLMFSGQCTVDIKEFQKKPNEQEIKKLFPQYTLAIFISQPEEIDNKLAKNSLSLERGPQNREQRGSWGIIHWRIFDTMKAHMIDGKEYIKRGNHWRGWAHNIADQLWPLLTGQPAFFSSRIAFCKDAVGIRGKINKEIWVADFDGTHMQRVVDFPTVNVAPRWNHDKFNPLIFYSRYTNTNMQLMVLDRKRNHKIASDFDGSNMLPAFSDDGKMIVYCASRGDGECHLYHYEKGIFERLTYNDGRNVSPTIAGSVVYFCSDFETNKPQIYKYTIDTKKTERITDGGYCASPRFSMVAQKLIYTKMIEGIMQLMMYDPKTSIHTQLTSDTGNKEECSWSPCGNYLVFSTNKGTYKQIMLLNRLTNEKRPLTKSTMYCGYPDWSPLYAEYPIFA